MIHKPGGTAMEAQPITRTGEVAIFGRILDNGAGAMSPELARYVLTLGFTKEDQERMKTLAERGQLGELTAEERDELMSFVRAGHLLALLHAKARKATRTKRAP